MAEVKTMEYRAKLLRKVGKYPKGKKVRVTRNLKKQWVMTADGTVIPQKSYIDLLKQWYDNKCRYDKATAEAFVNSHGWGSETDWLLWCNKWGQRMYFFQGSKGNWVLKRVRRCGTGSIKDGDGSDQGVGTNFKIWDKNKAYQGPRVVQYWNMHYTSLWGNSIHRGTVGKPSTHGCIALKNAAAKWAFNNIPIGSRVIVF